MSMTREELVVSFRENNKALIEKIEILTQLVQTALDDIYLIRNDIKIIQADLRKKEKNYYRKDYKND